MKTGTVYRLFAATAALLLAGFGATAGRAQQTPAAPAPAKTANQHYNDGVHAYQQSKWDDAIAAFTSAIEKRRYVTYADAYFGRGVCYNRKKEYKKAIVDFSMALMVKPNLADAYMERAVAYAGMGHFTEALTDYDRAEKNGANKSVLAQVRGSLYFQMKDYDKAIADWKAFLAATPNAPETIHYNIGLAYLEKKQYDRAVEAFTAALQRKPRYAPALTARAEAYLSMEPKQYAKAKADAEAALLVDRDDEKAKRLLDQANAGLRLD